MEVAKPERKPFADLLAEYRAGNPEAMVELFESYNAVIRAAVRRRLPEQLRREFDSLDFAQDVWASFCSTPANRRRFPTERALEVYLVKVARNKIVDAYRRRVHTTAHSAAKEQPLPEATRGHDPTPSQWMMAGEKWGAISSRLSPPHLAVIERLRAGFSRQEVADMFGITVRTVVRIIDKAQRACEEKA